MSSTAKSEPIRQKLTPPKIAEMWGISPHKVIGWIESGQLPAINAALTLKSQPRYLVNVSDLENFEQSRRVVPPQPRARRSKPDPRFELGPGDVKYV